MNTACLAAARAASPDLLSLAALFVIASFALSFLAFLAILAWLYRRPSRSNVLPLRRRRAEPSERAGAPDPRYDPRQFRSER